MPLPSLEQPIENCSAVSPFEPDAKQQEDTQAKAKLVLFGLNDDYDSSGGGAKLFCTSTLSWTSLPETRKSRNGFGYTYEAGKLYIAGGVSHEADANGVSVLSLDSLHWLTLCTQLPTERRGCSVVVRDNTLLTIGGLNQMIGGSLHSIDVLDLDTLKWSQLPQMAVARAWANAKIHNNNLIIIGGIGRTGKFLACGEVFSFHTNQWSSFPAPMPHSRGDFGMVLNDNAVYVIGGWNDEGPVKSAECFNYSTNEWCVLSNIERSKSRPALLGYCNAAMLDEKIFACFADSCFVYDLQSGEWTRLPCEISMKLSHDMRPSRVIGDFDDQSSGLCPGIRCAVM
jgi:hypothetical protein